MKKKKLKKEKKEVVGNPIYVKISSDEAINSKRDILSYQISLLNMIKAAELYSLTRKYEMEIKTNLQNTIKKTSESLKKIIENLPKVGEQKQKEKETISKLPKVEYYNQDLESQLSQIKKKLEEIGR